MTSHLFLTGATGLIGSGWLPRLLAFDPERIVTVLARRPQQVPRHPRVRTAAGDLTRHRLGLEPQEWDALSATVTDIVHCGADTRFNRSLKEARAVNTEGTRTLLALGRGAARLRRFAHISTAYVIGRDSGVLKEAEYRNRNGFVNSYQQSKYEAEQAVFDASREMPAAVYRLSSVAGGRQSYLHQALRFLPHNPLPVIPALKRARLDLIAEEWAAGSLSYLFERHFAPGSVFHVCAGPERSVSIEVLMRLAFGRHAARRQPAMVSLSEWDLFAQRVLGNGARAPMKQLVSRAALFLPHLALEQHFDTERTQKLLEGAGLSAPESVTLLRDLLDGLDGESARVTVPPREPVGRNAEPIEDL